VGVYRNTHKRRYIAHHFDGEKDVKIGEYLTYYDAEEAYKKYCDDNNVLYSGKVKEGYIAQGILAKKWCLTSSIIQGILVAHDKYYLGNRRGFAYKCEGVEDKIREYVLRKENTRDAKSIYSKPLLSMSEQQAAMFKKVADEFRNNTNKYWG
jgi:hypothetical protein